MTDMPSRRYRPAGNRGEVSKPLTFGLMTLVTSVGRAR